MTKRLHSKLGHTIRLLMLASVVPVAAAADPLTITRWTVDAGGTGYVLSGSTYFGGTVGQYDAGLLVGTGFSVAGGFWFPGQPLPLGVGDDPGLDPGPLPLELRIFPAAPNPVARNTRIRFELPSAREVDVRVFDVAGSLVRTLKEGPLPAGRHALDWDVVDARGRRVAAGLYLLRIRLGDVMGLQKLAVLR